MRTQGAKNKESRRKEFPPGNRWKKDAPKEGGTELKKKKERGKA